MKKEVFNYDSWAAKQLQNNYGERKATLLWKAEQLARLIPAHTHFSTALEVGCAEGIVINHLRELVNIEKCFGTDICQTFLRFGKKHFPDIEFIHYDGLNFPFPDQFASLIILSDIIEHIDDLFSFFQEVKRVAKYGLLKVPLDEYLWRKLISKPLGRSPLSGFNHPDGHLHEFTEKSCKTLLIGIGFKILASKILYQEIGQPNYHTKSGILKARWYIDFKLKQLFPEFAHRIFGGNLIVFFHT